MNKKNLIILALASLSVLNSFSSCSCKRDTYTSSIEEVSLVNADEALLDGAHLLWDDLSKENNTYVYANMELPKMIKVLNNSETVSVSWTVNVTKGTQNGVRLKEILGRQETHQGVYIGYIDNVIQEETEFELVPTLDFKGTTKSLGDILSSTNKIVRKVKKLEVDTYEEFVSKCNKAQDNTSYNKDSLVAISGYITYISLDQKYLFIQDDENNHGYIADITNYKTLNFNVGDRCVVAGQGYVINKRYGIFEPTVTVVEKFAHQYRPDYVNVSNVFNNITDSTLDNLIPYVNLRIKIDNVKLIHSDDNYKFSINNTEFEVYYSNRYFLYETERDSAYYEFLDDFNADIKGVLININGSYKFMFETVDPIDIKLSTVEKLDYVKDHLLINNDTVTQYQADMTLLLVSTHHFNSQITWELKSTTNSLAFVLDNGILYLYRDKIRYGVTETATIVATITIDGQSVTKQFTISLV